MSDEQNSQKRNLRPFTRRGRATADGIAGGTTIVSLWNPAVPEGLFEGDDYWEEGQVLILSGDMADQVREITGFVQATGVITVAPRFVNPVVSLLTVDSPNADEVIDVADASLFIDTLLAVDAPALSPALVVVDATQLRPGAAVIFDDTGASEAIAILAVDPATNAVILAAPLGAAYALADAAGVVMAAAYIWDDTPDAEAVVLIGIDQTLNQLTIPPPGIVAATGYTVAQNAAISISPAIIDNVEFVLSAPQKVVDTGEHTNPRRYEKDNGFRSPVVARAGGVATPLYTVATAPARTAGQSTTIYTLEVENATGAAITAWLEIGGVAVTVPIHVANLDSVFIDFPGGKTLGDNDINCNASVNAVNFSISGTEA